jgi:citrate lyase subunit beta/citryl-CoA lyase
LATLKNRLRRNMILVPGDNGEKMRDALEDPGIDSVILDLEDLVAPSQKNVARARVCEAVASEAFHRKGVEVVVRINAPDTPFYLDDVHDLMVVKPDMLRLPKVECREDVLCVDSLIAAYEEKLEYEKGSVFLMAAIESAKGVLNAYEIATSCPRLIGIALAAADYTEDLRVVRTKEGKELDWARGMILHAARAAGIFAIDTSFTFLDIEAFEQEVRHAKELGFDGKTGGALMPGMTEIINKAFSPSAEEIAYAKKILAMEKKYAASGQAVGVVGEVFLDKPIVEQYRRLLRNAGELDD